MTVTTSFSPMTTPIGRLLLVSRRGKLSGVYMEDHARGPLQDASWVQDEALLAPARHQLAEYFAGERTSFDAPLSMDGTPFQRRVWEALASIPFGQTITYGELARRVGLPSGARAVGGANARNPVSIIVPCHRVIGIDGSLTGYAGGEERKRWLLAFERRVAALTKVGDVARRRERPATSAA